MPRARKPTALLELSGAYKKNPQRRQSRASEPQPREALGPRVEKLNKLQAACWDRIVALAPPGVLKSSDEAIVELTARLWATVKGGDATAAEVTQFRACLQQLGMTPASRSLVAGSDGAKPKNEFAEV